MAAKPTPFLDDDAMKSQFNDHKELHQFELELIELIRDKHPVIYKKDMMKFKKLRAAAWENIAKKFPKFPVLFLKKRWQKITSDYLQRRYPTNSHVNVGILSFLDEEYQSRQDNTVEFKNIFEINDDSDECIEIHDERQNKICESKDQQQDGNNMQELDLDLPTNHADVKKLLHEELDISDNETAVKEEVLNEQDEEIVNANDEENFCQPSEFGTCKIKKKWSEEELLNSTCLTIEMIEELIRIKTRNGETTLSSEKTGEKGAVIHIDSDRNS